MIKVYQKHPITFEQFDGSEEMIDKYDIESTTMCMPTKHSYMRVCKKDWIATGVNSEHWVIDDNTFQDNYAELPVIPIYVHIYIRVMRLRGKTLGDAIKYFFRDEDIEEYIEDNSETFSRAWLDGYQVEADK